MARILVVDDSKVARMTLASAFREAGHEVIEAEDGRQGVEAYRTHRPAVTFLDLTMPVMDGFEALAEIRHLDPKAKVVMVTADTKPATLMRIEALQAFSHLRKFPTKEGILEALEAALAGRKPPTR